jgi:hypothetical protein
LEATAACEKACSDSKYKIGGNIIHFCISLFFAGINSINFGTCDEGTDDKDDEDEDEEYSDRGDSDPRSLVKGDDLESEDLSPSEEDAKKGVSDTTEREMGGGEEDSSLRRCLVRLGEDDLGKGASIVELLLLLLLQELESDWTTTGETRATGRAPICLLAAVLAFVSRISSTSSGVILASCANKVHPAVGFL